MRTVAFRLPVASNYRTQAPSHSDIVLYGRDCMIGMT
jgi:hypothetical protein